MSRSAKVTIHKTIISPIVTYVSKFWKKVFRKIYVPVRDPTRAEYRRTNKEIEVLYKDGNIVQELKYGKLR